MKIIDNTSRILLKNEKIKDNSLQHAAMDIETIVKIGGRTPVLHGGLKASIHHQKLSTSRYRIIIPKVYAAYQERGMRADGTHVVRRYTTPGTGKGWFAGAIKTVTKNFNNIIRSAAKAEGF